MKHFLESLQLGSALSVLDIQERLRIIREADDVLGGRWDLFPGIPVRLKPAPSWNRTVRGRGWWMQSRRGAGIVPPWVSEDIKFVWELNRMQFLLPLAQAFVLTGDQRYAGEVRRLISHWIDSHPRQRGLNWTSALETSLRVLSWIWALALTGDPDERVEESIRRQCDFIEEHLQRRECPNNHLIGELCCLTVAGFVFPDFPAAARWREDGVRSLTEQISVQTFPDGVDREQAWDYHRFVADFCTLVLVQCRCAGMEAPLAFRARLEKMYEAMLSSVRPDGWGPMAGDDDSARALRLSGRPGRYFLSALSTGAVLFNRQDMKYASRGLHPETIWLLGEEGRLGYEKLVPAPPGHTSVFMEDSGQAVMRSGWDEDAGYLIFDCGDQGMGEAGHGHADALHFELCAHGRPRIVDAGTYLYNRCPRWRNYFRGTSAHNTVRIDGHDQSRSLSPRDPFGWEQKADARCRSWYTSGRHDFALAGYDGCARQRGIKHERSVSFMKPDSWIISDEVAGEGAHTSEFFLHFPPGTRITRGVRSSLSAVYPDGAMLLIIPTNPEGLSVSVVEGSERPLQGWVSESFGTKQPAPVLCMRRSGALPHSFETVIIACKPGQQCLLP